MLTFKDEVEEEVWAEVWTATGSLGRAALGDTWEPHPRGADEAVVLLRERTGLKDTQRRAWGKVYAAALGQLERPEQAADLVIGAMARRSSPSMSMVSGRVSSGRESAGNLPRLLRVSDGAELPGVGWATFATQYGGPNRADVRLLEEEEPEAARVRVTSVALAMTEGATTGSVVFGLFFDREQERLELEEALRADAGPEVRWLTGTLPAGPQLRERSRVGGRVGDAHWVIGADGGKEGPWVTVAVSSRDPDRTVELRLADGEHAKAGRERFEAALRKRWAEIRGPGDSETDVPHGYSLWAGGEVERIDVLLRERNAVADAGSAAQAAHQRLLGEKRAELLEGPQLRALSLRPGEPWRAADGWTICHDGTRAALEIRMLPGESPMLAKDRYDEVRYALGWFSPPLSVEQLVEPLRLAALEAAVRVVAEVSWPGIALARPGDVARELSWPGLVALFGAEFGEPEEVEAGWAEVVRFGLRRAKLDDPTTGVTVYNLTPAGHRVMNWVRVQARGLSSYSGALGQALAALRAAEQGAR
jgi:hypothetical protein